MCVDVDSVDVCAGVGLVSGSTNAECTEDSVEVEMKGICVLGNAVCPGVGEYMDVLEGEMVTGVGEFSEEDLCVGELPFNGV